MKLAIFRGRRAIHAAERGKDIRRRRRRKRDYRGRNRKRSRRKNE
jgi:hypothetical protein